MVTRALFLDVTVAPLTDETRAYVYIEQCSLKRVYSRIHKPQNNHRRKGSTQDMNSIA